MTDIRDVAGLRSVVADARRSRTPIRFVGAGRWVGAGSPASRIASRATPVSLAPLSGVVEYVPNDLTITVRAGTTLAELDAATGAHNQWCPLLPWGDDDATVGATFATATTGPCTDALGRPRDLALGVEFVDGTGSVARGGGRVVKNVAGFDLTRLFVGSFGSLGAITELTLRLRARPASDVTLAVTPRGSVHDATPAIRSAELQPYACVKVAASHAGATGHGAGTVIVRYGGNASFVAAARASLDAFGDVTQIDPSFWTRWRALDPQPRRLDDRSLDHAVARRIKDRFDPDGILNPGVLGEAT